MMNDMFALAKGCGMKYNIFKTLNSKAAVCLMFAVLLSVCAARANNIAVTNIVWGNAPAEGESYVQFDLAWENSWRAEWTESAAVNVTGQDLSVTNWDAAWVFVKYRLVDGNNWQHATLSAETADHQKPADAALDVGLDNNGTKGIGVFIYRAVNGHGNTSFANVKLRWLHEADGVAKLAEVDLAVHAIEMVYVAGGPFKLGDAGSGVGVFREGGSANTPFLVDAAWSGPVSDDPETDARRIADTPGRLWAAASISASVLNDLFPTGYDAFYCMKYEITQGQYTAFLNSLSSDQADNRFPAFSGYRFTIGGSWPNFTNAAPDRACNFLEWPDLCAYVAWAGLRPMTELEFEKAGRGSLNPNPSEYAWGPGSLTQLTGLADEELDGTGLETAFPASANCQIGNPTGGLQGPVRVGIYAKPGSTRLESGSSYWGVMELSGSIFEGLVTVVYAAGRAFTGLHGEGALASGGDADISGWPGQGGAAIRGGSWLTGSAYGYISDRVRATVPHPSWQHAYGGRAVRTAP